MKVLITGGAGFLGAWTIRALLDAGHEVRVFDTHADRRIVHEVIGAQAQALDWQIGDIAQAGDVLDASAGCDSAIHLAGVLTPTCRAQPLRSLQINVTGTLHVFEAARRRGWKQLAYASSAGVYGPDDATHPRPATLYGTWKLACEGIARAHWDDAPEPERIASVGLRPFVVYGAGREGGLSAGPSLACRAAVRGEACTIPFSGATGFVYVEDVAQAFVAAVTRPLAGAHAFNLPGVVATTEELIAQLRALCPHARLHSEGPPLPITPHLPPDDMDRCLPGLPHTSLAEGLARTVACYRQREAAPSLSHPKETA